MNDRVFDVLIVGAGLSGVGAAFHLQKYCPAKSIAILEARDDLGGTWDLFRYPGIRSDSDMFTLGYGFHPWREAKAIADGPSIKRYVRETAAAYGIDKKIQFGCRVKELNWSSDRQLWTVSAVMNGKAVEYRCNFLFMCSGYYNYEKGYLPSFPYKEDFKGEIVHPQHWPENLNYANKRVVVIGSGATAVTLIPSMADKTAHITMLQRSPTFMFSMPGHSPLAKFLERFLPRSWVYWLMRWQRIILQQIIFKRARAHPARAKERLIELTREKLNPEIDVDRHFTPSYNPWDQRLCLVPDDDLFTAFNSSKASIATGRIDRFTENGIRLEDGQEIEADIIVTATGLNLELLGGADVSVDGKAIKLGETFTYQGSMFSGVPNLASVFGYTNASWTLRADLVSEHVCRLINAMDEKGAGSATPRPSNPHMPQKPFADFSSGYFQRAIDKMPKQGEGAWRHRQDYAKDIMSLRFGKIDDGELDFAERNPQGRITAETTRIAAE